MCVRGGVHVFVAESKTKILRLGTSNVYAKALVRLSSGSFKALSRRYQGSVRALVVREGGGYVYSLLARGTTKCYTLRVCVHICMCKNYYIYIVSNSIHRRV